MRIDIPKRPDMEAKDNFASKTNLAVSSTESTCCVVDEGQLWENISRKMYGFLSMPQAQFQHQSPRFRVPKPETGQIKLPGSMV